MSERQVRGEKGPLIEILKYLSTYGSGKGKKYNQLLIPDEFFELHDLRSKGKIPIQVYYSPFCKRFLLLSLGQWPILDEKNKEYFGDRKEDANHAKIVGTNAQTDKGRPKETDHKLEPFLQLKSTLKIKDIENVMAAELATLGARAFMREAIFAGIEQGIEEIVVQAENMPQFDEAYRTIIDSMESHGLADIHKVQESCRINIILVDDPKHIRGGNSRTIRASDQFDLRALTEQMLDEVISFLKTCIELLRIFAKETEGDRAERKGTPSKLDSLSKITTDTLQRLEGQESYIDFLWAYNCRQLIRAGRYGLFSGVGLYTSITPVALGSFYKLLEHAVDQSTAIVKNVARCFDSNPPDGIKQFMNELITQLSNTLVRLKKVEQPLLNAIQNTPVDADKNIVATILKEYHTVVRPIVGTTGESYLDATEAQIEKTLGGVDPNTALILGQTLYPLQKLCKFPANVAMLARILNFSTILSSEDAAAESPE